MDKNTKNKSPIHKILVHSYLFYFIFFLAGIFFDMLFPTKIIDYTYVKAIGFLLIGMATFLVVWAQSSSRELNIEKLSKNVFCKGPYKFLSNPTHLGISLLLFGFGLISGAVYMLIATVLYFILAHFIFIKKQDTVLEAKYGKHFKEYKKTVKF
ncbi:MAG: hypothetical protein K9L98_00170 [Candidatus Pacebacteria bacterium]|nr:hypothetical protein [Candidatus Paceibacterota bacterium]MCF7862419.1 hypothetical protein [Candidatus Paceibacterota bacterium]